MRSIAIIALTCAAVSFVGNAAAQDAVITKDDKDALVSASNIFMGRYPIGLSWRDQPLLRMVTPTSGYVERTDANFRKTPDAPCTYQMFGSHGDIAAQIDFSKLSEEYAVNPSGYGGSQLTVFGQGPAVCDQFDGLGRIDPKHARCYDRYVSASAEVRVLLRYFRYMFSNVCPALQFPIN
jgi:hypothetical protein